MEKEESLLIYRKCISKKEALNMWPEVDTLRVCELIDLLKKYPEQTLVYITWESTIRSFSKRDVYKSKDGFLYLDGDDSFYKEEFALDPKENEEK